MPKEAKPVKQQELEIKTQLMQYMQVNKNK